MTAFFGAKRTAQSSSGGGKWKHDNMLLAAKEFEVPASTKMLLFFPEIFDRDLLRKDPKFHFQLRIGRLHISSYLVPNRHLLDWVACYELMQSKPF